MSAQCRAIAPNSAPITGETHCAVSLRGPIGTVQSRIGRECTYREFPAIARSSKKSSAHCRALLPRRMADDSLKRIRLVCFGLACASDRVRS